MSKLRDGDFRFVERLLYDQKTHDTAIAELQAELDDMIPSASCSVVQFDHNSATPELTQPERVVDKRLHSIRGRYLHEEITKRRRHQQAVSEAMKCLDDLEARLVFLKYQLEKSSRDCWRTMGLQKSRFYEMRREVVTKIGRFLGM